MKRALSFTILCLLGVLELVCSAVVRRAGGEECQGKPADVVFVMDSSGSIWAPDFTKQLKFVQGVVDIFDLSKDMTQVGAISFSNWAFLDFHLKEHNFKHSVKAAVGHIKQIRGDTNTAAALHYMKDASFSDENGARRGVPHVAIVLTDGKSNDPIETAKAADLARAAGIHIFAIGIGNEIDERELRSIANYPWDKHVFHVSSYSALDSIKELLAIEACKVPDPPTTLAPTTEKMLVDQACGEAALADIVFATSPGSTLANTNKALDFFKQLVSGFNLDNDGIHIGLVPKDCVPAPNLELESSDDTDTLIELFAELESNQPTPASALRYMRRVSFNTRNGARPNAKRIGVIIIDDEDDKHMLATMREAAKAKIIKNIELFVIGVGKKIAPIDLEAMASEPAAQHAFHVSNYEELFQITELVRRTVCPVPAL